MTLAATIYMTVLGKEGFKEVANLCYQKAHFAADQLNQVDGYQLAFADTPFFHEFVVKSERPVAEVLEWLREHDILGGYDLGQDYPELENHLMLAVTEKISREDIEFLTAVLEEEYHD